MDQLNKDVIFTGVIMDEQETFRLADICEQYDISQDLVALMVEHSLIPPIAITDNGDHALNYQSLQRIEKALHLQRDLEINLQGVVLALELLDELQHVKTELTILHRHLK